MALAEIFGDENSRRRRRAKKAGRGGVSRNCPGGKCKKPIPSRHQRIRGKIKKVPVPDSPPPEIEIESHSEPRFLQGGATPPRVESNKGGLKNIFSRKTKRSKASYK